MHNLNLRRFFRDLYESIAGTEQDFTSGSLGRAIMLLSIPMVLEMVMESIFAIVDIYFVSRLGADAVAVVGITESVITIVYAIAGGMSIAATALVSRRIGEKDHQGACRAAFQAIVAAVAVSLILGIPGWFFAEEVLTLMGSPPEEVERFSGYTSLMIGSNIVIMLLFIINAVFRSAGDAAISMKILFIANLFNIVLDPVLIFGWGPFPEMGIKGAALATVLGRGLAVVYQLFLLFRGKHRVSLSLEYLNINLKEILKLFRLSMGGIGQSLIATSSWILLVRIIALFGSEAVAGYTIAIRVILVSMLPSSGIANAAATLVGQNLGARLPGRAERAVWTTSVINFIIMGGIGLLFAVSPEPFIRFFTPEQSVIESGSHCLRIMSYGFIFYGVGMVIVNSFNGAGDTLTPVKINFFCYWLLELTVAWLLAVPARMNEQGVYYAILIAEAAMTVTAVLIFRKGKWKLKQV
ncbi:MAG TPA: MATE family efflux transporter [Bacteroidales bacterium]|nr:MATE family efflux transporter [Bacteroidales bacterium]